MKIEYRAEIETIEREIERLQYRLFHLQYRLFQITREAPDEVVLSPRAREYREAVSVMFGDRSLPDVSVVGRVTDTDGSVLGFRWMVSKSQLERCSRSDRLVMIEHLHLRAMRQLIADYGPRVLEAV